MEDIKHTYFVPYYAPAYSFENPVEEAILSLGGKPATHRKFRGNDEVDGISRQFEFWFTEYEFPNHSVRVFLTGEMYPQPLPDSKRITGMLIRVRLGNYNLEDKLTHDISDTVSEISKEALAKYPIDNARDMTRFM